MPTERSTRRRAVEHPLLRRLGETVARRRRGVLVTALLATIGLGVLASGAMDAMVLSRWEAPGTESVRAQDVLAEQFGTGNANVVLVVEAERGTVDDPAVQAAATALADRLAAEDAVGDVWSYWSENRDPALRSTDGREAVVLGWVTGDATEARAAIAKLIPEYTRTGDTVTVQVAGGEAASTQISALAAGDFVRAELVIVPTMLILLLVVYRRVVPAMLTLGVGLFSVLGTLALLRLLAEVVELSTFAANITLVMGIGLGVDYSLFVIARFREEVARGRQPADAVARTVETAGRTVVFSGLTVAAALSVLLAFPYPFLRSFGYAGVLVVVTAVVGALTVLPAAAATWAHRVVRKRVPPGSATTVERGFWYGIGARVMRRPAVFGAGGLVLVVVLGSPALGLRIGLPDDRVLPTSASTRQAYDTLRTEFSHEPNDAIHVVLPRTGPSQDRAAVARYAAELSQVPGILQVNSVAGSFRDGQLTRPAAEASSRLTGSGGTRLEAFPTHEALAGTDVDLLVDRIRATPAPSGDVVVGGYPAELADFRAVLLDRVPLVGGLILLVTFVVLFLMSGSLLIPVKATVLNLLSMSVMFGALVFVFQDGFLAGPLGFTATGTLDPAFPILMFCVAYGLSMDYEVFMLSRIKEEYERTGDNTHAVLHGLQRSAPLITAAAVILATSFAIYASGEIKYLKMLGIGTALAIVVDATVIRAILVPAFMRLTGRANWWVPRPLRRFHDRFGVRETGATVDPADAGVRDAAA